MPKGIYKHSKLSKEQKEKISKALKGRVPWNKGKKVVTHYKNIRRGKYVACPATGCNTKKYRYPSQIDKYNNYCSKDCWYGHMRNGNNPMQGRKHSAENVEKNRQRQLGTKASEKTKEKLRISSKKNARYGAANNFWKGVLLVYKIG